MKRGWFSTIGTTIVISAVAILMLIGGSSTPGITTQGGIGAATSPDQIQSPAGTATDGQLHSELLMTLVFERGPANNPGSPGGGPAIVPVADGTFEGPGLKGTIVAPSGEGIVSRPDSSSLLNMRAVLQTDDGQKISMTWGGIAYTGPGGILFARILPTFETRAPQYAWLNKIVAVGVYQPMGTKIVYRVYKIL